MNDTKDILTIDNLETGISSWRKKLRWDQDFHNSFYMKLQRYKVGGLNREWWDRIVDDLSSWKAIRPYPKEYIHERGLDYVPSLQKEHLRVLKIAGYRGPNLETTTWEILSGLFDVASDIKETMFISPVFASKLCHFIFPNAFPVVDREMVRISGFYSRHWHYCQTQWINCKVKNDLIRILNQDIDGKVFEHFPWATKIVEICIIGDKIG